MSNDIKCPTCGAEVKVVGDVTCHYEPLYNKKTLESLQSDLDKCNARIKELEKEVDRLKRDLSIWAARAC